MSTNTHLAHIQPILILLDTILLHGRQVRTILKGAEKRKHESGKTEERATNKNIDSLVFCDLQINVI